MRYGCDIRKIERRSEANNKNILGFIAEVRWEIQAIKYDCTT